MVILYVITFLLISIVILELSFLLLQVSGLLASYEETTCKCVMEVITYWSHKHKNTQRLDKLLIESPAPSPAYHGYLVHLPAS